MTQPEVLTANEQGNADAILEVNNLKTYFYLENATVRAVDGVSLTLGRQKTLGMVGESGCGKSITAMSIMRLIQSPPGKIASGQILLHPADGSERSISPPWIPRPRDAPHPRRRDRHGLPGADDLAQPAVSIGRQIAESVEIHQGSVAKEAMERALEMLKRVQISDAERRLDEYPHQMSGGMRQRVMIALALSCNPSILIADEPTTALDVTVQAQILDLMRQLQADFDSSIILITHNLGVVSQLADHVAVMYLGKVVEYAATRELFHHPLHPYTVGLLNSVPVFGRARRELIPIKGMVPSPIEEIRGCAFATRCPRVMRRCIEQQPVLREVRPGHRRVAGCMNRMRGGDRSNSA